MWPFKPKRKYKFYKVVWQYESNRPEKYAEFVRAFDIADAWARVKNEHGISIHCNSAGNKSVSGVETFLATPARSASTADKKRPHSFRMRSKKRKTSVEMVQLRFFLANGCNFDTKISWSGCVTPLDTFDFV